MNSSTCIKNREQLACVLRQAAQLEHLLACQYLFAAFTLRKEASDFPPGFDERRRQIIATRNQRWGFKVLQIARQEMEHLGIVNNLLGALGEEAYFDRPNFPLPRTLLPIDTPFLLQRFGRPTLERFLAYERPDFLEVPDAWRSGGPPDDCVKPEECPDGEGGTITFRDVQQLYEEIGTAFQTLPPQDIFLGNTQRQVDDEVAPVAAGLGVTLEPVTDRASAASAIGLVLEQGEGIGDTPLSPDSHFSSFNEILQQFLSLSAEEREETTLPVVESPLLEKHNACSQSAFIITDPFTRQAAALFNQAYAIMLVCLKLFFESFLGFWGPGSVVTGLEPLSKLRQRTRNGALMEAAFFPFMTMAIRPLGELLCRLPASQGTDQPLAGPTFELKDGRVPDWTGDELEGKMLEFVEQAWALEKAAPDGLKARIRFIAENMSRMTANFIRVWNAVPE